MVPDLPGESMPADAQVCCGRHPRNGPLAQACVSSPPSSILRAGPDPSGWHEVFTRDMKKSWNWFMMLAEPPNECGGPKCRRAGISFPQADLARPEVTPQRVYVSCDGIMYCTNRERARSSGFQAAAFDLAANEGRMRLLGRRRRPLEKANGLGPRKPAEFAASLFWLACRCGYRQVFRKRPSPQMGPIGAGRFKPVILGDATGILVWYTSANISGPLPTPACLWKPRRRGPGWQKQFSVCGNRDRPIFGRGHG